VASLMIDNDFSCSTISHKIAVFFSIFHTDMEEKDKGKRIVHIPTSVDLST